MEMIVEKTDDVQEFFSLCNPYDYVSNTCTDYDSSLDNKRSNDKQLEM